MARRANRGERVPTPTGSGPARGATYAQTIYMDAGATLDDRREAVTTLEDTVRIARRVLGGAHPLTGRIELHLREARAALGTSEGDDVESIREGVDALNA